MGDVRNLNEYFRALQKLLVCPKLQQTHFLAEAHHMADDYQQGNLDANDQDVIEFLGPPEELASTFLETLDPEILCRYHTRRTWLNHGIALCATVAICVLAAWCLHLKTRTIVPTVTVTETSVIYPEVTE